MSKFDELTWNQACEVILRENIKIDDDIKNKLAKRFNNPADLYYICAALSLEKCEQFEKIISESVEYSILYAMNVLDGKLPEFMHNKILASYLRNPEISKMHIKTYFKLYCNV